MPTVPNTAIWNRRYAILREVSDALGAVNCSITNIEAVVAAIKVPSQDIIDEFGSTGGLVVALVEMLAVSMLEPLDDRVTEMSFQQKLLAFADRVTDESSVTQLKCLYRIALTEVIRNTGIGRDFYKHGPGLVTAELARFFRTARTAGVGLAEDSHYLASHLMALLRAELELHDALPLHASSEPTSFRGNVLRSIRMFCAGIQMEAKDAYAAL